MGSIDITATLKERGQRYGLFEGHATITQLLKADMQQFVPPNKVNPAWHSLTPSQQEALEMIAHKVGRILNGDPNYDDSWVDIAGYAQLVVDQLRAAPAK